MHVMYLYMYLYVKQGLYPESHGIIDNNMYDMKLGKSFYLSSTQKDDPGWWDKEAVSI